MKKKIFKEFIALFNALNSAGSLLAGYDKMQFNGELAKNEKEQAEIKEQFKLADELSVMDALEKAESFNIDNLFDEIEKNFYDHKISIDIYISFSQATTSISATKQHKYRFSFLTLFLLIFPFI